MRKIAFDRAVRLSERLIHLEKYLRFEAEEEYLADQIAKYGSLIGDAVLHLESAYDQKEYTDGLKYGLMSVMKVRRWLKFLYEENYLEDQTYKSLLRECDDLFNILMRKSRRLFDELLGDMDL